MLSVFFEAGGVTFWTGILSLIRAYHGSEVPRPVRANRGQKVLQWRNDTPVTLAQGCDLWSRSENLKLGIGVALIHDVDQLT